MKRCALGWVAGLLACVSAAHAELPLQGDLHLRAFERDSLAMIRQAHAGQPFVLAMWSVYCEPCRAEMEMLSRFKAANPEVRVVLIAADPPEDADAVRRMLLQHAPAGAETWAFADAFVERLRYAVDPRWRGELPRTYLFDAEHQSTAVSGAIKEDALATWWQARSAAP